MQKKQKNKKGFSLIFALLIISIVVSIGISVFEIFFIESGITRNITESQHAFYAADTGTECVLYWDLKQAPPFSTTTSKTISCNNETKTVGGAAASSFQLLINNGTCANITVNINPLTGQRTIEALGRSRYDLATNNCNTPYPTRAERGIETNYY